jgi:hypothetical protein
MATTLADAVGSLNAGRGPARGGRGGTSTGDGEVPEGSARGLAAARMGLRRAAGLLRRPGSRIVATVGLVAAVGVSVAGADGGASAFGSRETAFAAQATDWYGAKPAIEVSAAEACGKASGHAAVPTYEGSDPVYGFAHALLATGWQAQVDAACGAGTGGDSDSSVQELGSAMIAYSSGVLAESDGMRLLANPSMDEAKRIARGWKHRAAHAGDVGDSVLDAWDR